MKFFLLFMFVITFFINVHSQASQNFGSNGIDSESTVLSINSTEITVNGNEPLTSVILGEFTTHSDTPTGNATYCGDWYSFDLEVIGGIADGTNLTGCDSDFNGLDVTGFTTINITSNDLDGYSDIVYFDIDLLVTFIWSDVPLCDVILTETEVLNTSGNISWSQATGVVDNYLVSVGSASGLSDIYSETLGNTLFTNIGVLNLGTTYYVNIIPSNSFGDAIECIEQTLTVLEPPVNDDCANAILLDFNVDSCATSVVGNNTLATDSGLAQADCMFFPYSGGDLWYSINLPIDQTGFQVTIIDSDLSFSVIELYSGTCGGSLVEETCVIAFDDAGFLDLTGGETYYLRFYDSGNNNFGNTEFCIQQLPPAPECASNPNIPNLEVDVSIGYTTLAWDPPTTGLTPTSYAVYLGGSLDNLNSSLPIFVDTIFFDYNIFAFDFTYYWKIVPRNGASEAVGCPIWQYTTMSTPTGAFCSDPIIIDSLPYNVTGDTDDFGSSYSNSNVVCSSSPFLNGSDIVYSLTPTEDQVVSIILSNTNNLSGVFVFEGCNAPPNVFTECIANDTNNFGNPSIDSVILIAGTTYYIIISTIGSQLYTPFTMDIEEVIPNNDCLGALPINYGEEVAFSNIGATDSGVASDCFSGEVRDLWYSFIASATNELYISTTAAQYGIYSDCMGTQVGNCNTSPITGLIQGETYYIRVSDDGAGRTPGDFTLLISKTILSINQLEEEIAFTLHPNLVKDKLTLESKSAIENVTIYSFLGQELTNIKPNSVNCILDMSILQSGTYFVKVTIADVTKVVRFIKM